MGKKKSSGKPKAPNVVKPASISTPMGSAIYNNGTYNYSSPDDAANQASEGMARTGFQNSLAQVNNPTEAINHQQDIYRNAMMPAFEQQANKDMGTTVAGLGNRYAGTFGQLAAGQQAINNGIGRANVEKSIYDSGQSSYDQMINRANTFGQINNQAQQIRMAPYNFLNQAVGVGGQNVNGYNNAQGNNFGTQAGMYNADAYQRAMALQALGQVAQAGTQIGMGLATGGASTVAGGVMNGASSAFNASHANPFSGGSWSLPI